MKHTPGPWAVSQNDWLVFGKKQGNGLEPIGFIYGAACAEKSEYGRRSLANVKLCAAAPALLEALETMCDEQDAQQGYCSVEVYDKARAAIATAKGEAA